MRRSARWNTGLILSGSTTPWPSARNSTALNESMDVSARPVTIAMRLTIGVAGLALLVGCVSVSEVKGPDGKPALAVKCGDATACYQRAGELSDWMVLAGTDDGMVWLDRASIREQSPGIWIAWQKFSFAKAKRNSPSGREYRSILQLDGFQCGR